MLYLSLILLFFVKIWVKMGVGAVLFLRIWKDTYVCVYEKKIMSEGALV